MSFIKAQKIVKDTNGNIISGSAAIVDAVYSKSSSSGHSVHQVREKLGKIIYLSNDKKSGIFLSPTRGLVEYDTKTDVFKAVDHNDSRIITDKLFPETEVHTVFGDSYLLLNFLKNEGITDILKSIFPKNEEYERVLCHILHGVLKDGSRISCENFIQKSFASYIMSDVPLVSLKSDTRFFSMMGNDNVKVQFFKHFVSYMQKHNSNFGKGCYVDSTPLPNDIEENPFNALCCHGIASSEVMSRLVLVLDEDTGLPVWFDIIPGNILDMNTIMKIVNNVATTLNIEIESLVLDAGYVSEDLVHTFHIGNKKTIIARMPARKGYPFKSLYWEVKDLINKGKYAFVRKHHTYFGIQKEISLFDEKIYAYVYVDHNTALKRFSDYLTENEEEYSQLKSKDKDWMVVKNGYFVLISNTDTTPDKLLSDYFGRADIETVFKTSKEYLDLLPLSKWSDTTVRGKIFHDIIDTIILLLFRKKIKDTGYSASELFGRSQSLMCFKNNNGIVTIETPNKQVKECYNLLKIDIPTHEKVDGFKSKISIAM